MNKPVYIVRAKRTAIGKLGGALSMVRPDDMLADVFRALTKDLSFPLELIDDVIAGCANQAGEDNRNVARMSSLLAGIPMSVPATTINRLCGSSLDATIDGYARIQAGIGDCFLIGGVESMTRAPFVMSKTSSAFGGDSEMFNTTFGWRFVNPKMKEMFPILSMGETAEEVIKLYNIPREEQDQFAFNSHQKAVKAITEGKFKDEIVPIEIKERKSTKIVDTDEGPRADTNMAKLAELKPAFRKDGSVTAGNASSLNDGASGVLIVSGEFLKKWNLTPLVEITGGAVKGLHPNTMGLGPVEAVKVLCDRFGKKVSDFDAIELNEAFAGQVLGCVKALELDLNKINMRGGSIALGHPLGCSGTRILTTLTHIMKDNKALKEGLATMCIGVGQGVALSVRNC